MTAEVKVRVNGSLKLTGPATLILADGSQVEIVEGESVALCRCGQSGNKPYCDATHKRIGWVDPAPVIEESPGVGPLSAI